MTSPASPATTAPPAAGRADPLALAAVLLAVLALFQVRTCLKLVGADDADILGEETNVVYALERFLGEGALYTDPGLPPYSAVQYGPAYFLIGRAAARLAGLAPDDAAAITRLLRGISLACLLGQVAAVGVILRRHLGASWPAVVAAGACVLVWQVPWCVTARPDSMESLLVILAALLGLEALRGGDGARPTAWLASALVVGVLATLTKQSGVVAGPIVLVPALAVLGWRRTATACVAASAVSAPLAAALLLPCGPAILGNLVRSVKNGVAFRAAIQSAYAPYLRLMAAPAAAALLAGSGAIAAAFRPGAGPRDRAAAAVGWGAVVSFAAAVGLATKYGSSVNYFDHFNLFIPLAVVPALAAAGGRRARAFAAAYLALALPAEAYDDLNAHAAPRLPYAGSAEVAGRLAELLAAAPPGTYVFSQDPRLDCLFPARAALPQAHLARVMYTSGAESFADFARAARDGTVRYCVTFDGDGPPAGLAESFRAFSAANGLAPDPDRPAFLGASFEGFRPLFRVGPHAVYESPQARSR